MTTVVAEIADRVDKVLARHFGVGRHQLEALFDEGGVKIAGKRARKSDRVAIGDVIEVARTPASGDALQPAPQDDARLGVLLERADYVVLDKPAGMPSQPLRAGELGTAANAIAARYPECRAIGDDPRDGGLVHRLDIGTSGVLIAARTPAAYRTLREAFGAGLVAKTYLAITDGRPVARECDAPLVQRGKRVIVDYTDGLAAFTAFAVERATATHAHVRCTAQTGRMHQVRAHLAHVGSPISGDTLYGGAPLAGDSSFFLHAATIALPDGTAVEAPLPARYAAALVTAMAE